jgi:hypothetical protein
VPGPADSVFNSALQLKPTSATLLRPCMPLTAAPASGSSTCAFFPPYSTRRATRHFPCNIVNCITFLFRKVSSLLYGGDNVTVPDPNPEKSSKFRVKLGQAYAFPFHCCIPVRPMTDPAATSTPPLGLAPPILTSSSTMMDAERNLSSGRHLKNQLRCCLLCNVVNTRPPHFSAF